MLCNVNNNVNGLKSEQSWALAVILNLEITKKDAFTFSTSELDWRCHFCWPGPEIVYFYRHFIGLIATFCFTLQNRKPQMPSSILIYLIYSGSKVSTGSKV